MTRRRSPEARPIVVKIAPVGPSEVEGFARVLAGIAVEKSLDSSPNGWDDVGNQHKAAPPSASTPSEAKEQVI
jgi:hypothetical protein